MGPEFCGREHVVVATAMTQRQIEDGALAELSQIEDGHLRFVPLGVAEFRAATGEAGVEQHVDLGGRAGEIEFVLDPEIAQACGQRMIRPGDEDQSEEHTSELQSLMRISYAAFCLKKKKKH